MLLCEHHYHFLHFDINTVKLKKLKPILRASLKKVNKVLKTGFKKTCLPIFHCFNARSEIRFLHWLIGSKKESWPKYTHTTFLQNIVLKCVIVIVLWAHRLIDNDGNSRSVKYQFLCNLRMISHIMENGIDFRNGNRLRLQENEREKVLSD